MSDEKEAVATFVFKDSIGLFGTADTEGRPSSSASDWSSSEMLITT